MKKSVVIVITVTIVSVFIGMIAIEFAENSVLLHYSATETELDDTFSFNAKNQLLDSKKKPLIGISGANGLQIFPFAYRLFLILIPILGLTAVVIYVALHWSLTSSYREKFAQLEKQLLDAHGKVASAEERAEKTMQIAYASKIQELTNLRVEMEDEIKKAARFKAENTALQHEITRVRKEAEETCRHAHNTANAAARKERKVLRRLQLTVGGESISEEKSKKRQC